jgi:hypothetical protein
MFSFCRSVHVSVTFALLSLLSGCTGEAPSVRGQELTGAGATGGTSPTPGAGTGGASAATGGMGGAGAGIGLGGMPVISPTLTGGAAGSAGSDVSAGSGGLAGRMVTEECAASKATATDTTMIVPADIIFAIDSSSSMADEIAFVQEQMNGFSQQITAAGVDAHVILVGDSRDICIGAPLGTGTCPTDENLPAYAHVDQGVGSNDALNLFIDTYAQWSQHLRPNASKAFVVVTDDDATDGPNDSAATFMANVMALDPTMFAKWTFNGVYCFTQCDQAAAIGTVYNELVTQTMGIAGDLCLQDFQPVFDRLAEQIITMSGSEITCEWELPAAPMGKTFAGDLVAVERSAMGMAGTPLMRVNSQAECAQGGWYFDSALNPSKILACPSTCMELQGQMGGQVDVTFGCESVGSCVATDSSTVMSADPCAFTMPLPPSGQSLDLTSVNVRYTSPSGFASDIGKVNTAAECSGVIQGWYFDDPAAPTQILACPQTCTEITAGGASAKLEVLFGCKTKPPIPA